MSDYPYKVGDLVHIKSSLTYPHQNQKPGVIVTIDKDTGFFEILVEDIVKKVHRNYVVVPKVRRVQMKGGLK